MENTCGLYMAWRQQWLHGGEKYLYSSLTSPVFASLRLTVHFSDSADEGSMQMERMLTFSGESIYYVGEARSLLALHFCLQVAETAAAPVKLKACFSASSIIMLTTTKQKEIRNYRRHHHPARRFQWSKLCHQQVRRVSHHGVQRSAV